MIVTEIFMHDLLLHLILKMIFSGKLIILISFQQNCLSAWLWDYEDEKRRVPTLQGLKVEGGTEIIFIQ